MARSQTRVMMMTAMTEFLVGDQSRDVVRIKGYTD
jgi:hypothetical protein